MAAIFQLVLIPFTLLNLFGGIGSGIWLMILGDWWAIGYGIAGILLSTYLLAFAMMPSLLILAPAMLLFEKGKPVLAIPFVLLGNMYNVALLSAWCMFVFWLFMNRSDSHDFIPLLIWSYGAALGPWMYMAAQELRGGGGGAEAILVFFGQIAYILVALVVIFSGSRLKELAIIFGFVMAIGLLTQLGLAILIWKTSRRASL